ncbi:MAG: putative acetolactate synthase, partial [Pseudomonadota bacterium]
EIHDQSVAALIARYLKSQDIKRVYGLCGGHIMPIWMRLNAEGIKIIDVRDERAAVYMAHAEAELGGGLGVALVTAGPGVTNAMTGIAYSHVARSSVLVLSGTPPVPQGNRGALQDIVHTDLVRSITRYARTVIHADLALQELDEAVCRSLGQGGEPGPTYLDFPVDVLRQRASPAVELAERFVARTFKSITPDISAVQAAVELLWSAKRPLVISGRGAKLSSAVLTELLTRTGAAYLDTGESKGLVPDDHPSVVAAMRGVVMKQADVVLTLGRRLDFQLAYGSPAVFGDAKFIRIADCAAELRDNRRGEVEILASCDLTLHAMLDLAGERVAAADKAWLHNLRQQHEDRSKKLALGMQNAPAGSDGLMHPNRILSALRDVVDENSIFIADGGDFLSFARVGLPASTYLDPGSLGCIGVGTPLGVAASLVCPEKTVVVATGDGSFGFNAMELDTAVRHNAPVLVVIANNGAWAIEVRDQIESYGTVVGTQLRFSDYAAMTKGLGLYAERVERAEDLPGAIARAMANRPALLDVLVTPEAVSSDAKSGLAWVPDLQALGTWDEAERQWRNGESSQR